MAFIIVRAIHILCMAFWLSSYIKELTNTLVFTGDQNKDRKQIVKREKIAGAIGTLSGMGTLISGGLLGYLYGFGNLPWPIHAGFAFAIAMAFVGAFGIGGVYHHLNKAVDRGADVSELQLLSGKLLSWSKAGLILWLVVLLLMTLRHIL
ncbi:hypothetical protein [Bacterioplanoides sp.]|uniref:hypothetical protein n=1 Tax=Bacterioplanoides sp. TaxID=2066072 RepID=UPI003B5CC780